MESHQPLSTWEVMMSRLGFTAEKMSGYDCGTHDTVLPVCLVKGYTECTTPSSSSAEWLRGARWTQKTPRSCRERGGKHSSYMYRLRAAQFCLWLLHFSARPHDLLMENGLLVAGSRRLVRQQYIRVHTGCDREVNKKKKEHNM